MSKVRSLLRSSVFLAVLILAPGQGQGGAFSGHQLDVYDNVFSDESLHARSLDTVTWVNREGRHNIVSYAGDQAIASKTVYLQGDPFVSSFGGGTILYRCTYHARITATGICEGMCGAVTDRTSAPASPTMQRVSEVSQYGKVDLAGTGEKWTTIVISENGQILAKALVGADGKWAAPIWVQSGSHSVQATATDVDGLKSPSSAVISITA